jgi:serine/threonine-protein kinase RsbW
MAVSTRGHVELRLPNRPEFVAVARLTVAAIACRMHFDVVEIEDIKVAVSEACTNAMEHGCGAPGDEMVTICCEMAETALTIAVTDPGTGTETTPTVRTPGARTATLAERGLGMILIQALMDTVEVGPAPDGGSQVRMTKRLSIREEEEA